MTSKVTQEIMSVSVKALEMEPSGTGKWLKTDGMDMENADTALPRWLPHGSGAEDAYQLSYYFLI